MRKIPRGSQNTYKGLKPAIRLQRPLGENCSQNTYKGLKQDWQAFAAWREACSQNTYKGLKPCPSSAMSLMRSQFAEYL